jgi:hypothetical protein
MEYRAKDLKGNWVKIVVNSPSVPPDGCCNIPRGEAVPEHLVDLEIPNAPAAPNDWPRDGRTASTRTSADPGFKEKWNLGASRKSDAADDVINHPPSDMNVKNVHRDKKGHVKSFDLVHKKAATRVTK